MAESIVVIAERLARLHDRYVAVCRERSLLQAQAIANINARNAEPLEVLVDQLATLDAKIHRLRVLASAWQIEVEYRHEELEVVISHQAQLRRERQESARRLRDERRRERQERKEHARRDADAKVQQRLSEPMRAEPDEPYELPSPITAVSDTTSQGHAELNDIIAKQAAVMWREAPWSKRNRPRARRYEGFSPKGRH